MQANGVINMDHPSPYVGQADWPNNMLNTPAFRDLMSRPNLAAAAQHNSPLLANWKGFPVSAGMLTQAPATFTVSEELAPFRNTFLLAGKVPPPSSSQPSNKHSAER